MVVRLEGKVQGQDVIFEHVQGDDWEAVIPPTLNGIYIVSLTAWDDAGNAAYTARYIITIDMDALYVCLEPYPFWADVLPWDYYARLCHGGDSTNNMKIIMDLGETRHVRLKICSVKKDNINIISAAYELQKLGQAGLEDSGACTIQESHIIDTVITPTEKGTYNLRIIYAIADEVLIDTVEVRVMA